MEAADFLAILKSGKILLCDGGMGTELQKRGLPPGACPEEYNFSHPQIVQEIHEDYFDVGADIVETNTFGGTRPRLAMHGLQDCVAKFSRRAAELARAVCPAGRFVAGSIGPMGEMLEPFGERTIEEAVEIFAEQARALAEGGVHVIFVETMISIEEAEAAVRAVKTSTTLPVVATMTFEVGKGGVRTKWGVDVPTAVERLTAAGADVIGSNCGRGFEEMLAVIEEMRPLTKLPVIAQANAGIPEMVEGRSVYKETPAAIVPPAEKLLQAGVNILGGCCGTGPEHIRRMRVLIDQIR